MMVLGKDIEPIFILHDEMVLGENDEYNIEEKNLHCIFYEEVLRGDHCNAYLIFVIFFTRAKFLENEIYTEKTRKLRQNTQ